MCTTCNCLCSCCRKTRHEENKKTIASFKKDGYTFQWTPKDEWRDRWWFFGKKRKQQKEVKIGYLFETYIPVLFYHWKTREII